MPRRASVGSGWIAREKPEQGLRPGPGGVMFGGQTFEWTLAGWRLRGTVVPRPRQAMKPVSRRAPL
jgi:hypothetical protein